MTSALRSSAATEQRVHEASGWRLASAKYSCRRSERNLWARSSIVIRGPRGRVAKRAPLHLDHLMHRHLHEARDFAGIGHASAPDPSAALSCRPCVPSSARTGLHISAGLLWLGTMMAQVFVEGFRPDILRRLVYFNLFWHSGSRPERRTFRPRLAPSSLRRH